MDKKILEVFQDYKQANLFSEERCSICPKPCCTFVQREFNSTNFFGDKVPEYDAPKVCPDCFKADVGCTIYEKRPIDCMSYPYFPCIKDGLFVGLWVCLRCSGVPYLTFEGFKSTKELWERAFGVFPKLWKDAVDMNKICWEVWKTEFNLIPAYFNDYEPTKEEL
jgi:hypothetical protein